MIAFWQKNSELIERTYIPKFYDPSIVEDLSKLEATHRLMTIHDMIETDYLSVATGDEIGKMAYGTGSIPFVRTSDISNWEIKSAPKQGVSEEIFAQYKTKQDVQDGDIFLVRDGTYLIGTNCFISSLDSELLYQSHILKFRLKNNEIVSPYLFFLALNSDIVQRQIRSIQFTADTIDTIGNRYLDIVIPIPNSEEKRKLLDKETQKALFDRLVGKAFVKQAPFLFETTLSDGNAKSLKSFFSSDLDDIKSEMRQDTVTAEFGAFETFWLANKRIHERILLPKYYDPEIAEELAELGKHCDCVSISQLIEQGVLEISTGDEIGKMAYGTGSIPFLRTSDFSNWEIKHDPKQGVSQEIYDKYSKKQNLKANDILLVRDGTYLVGSSCMVTENDQKSLFCGGLYKIRSTDADELDPFLLLGLLNSYIVKRQIRTKQFTRDVIDTIGQRLKEVVLPIPKSKELRKDISDMVENVVMKRIYARRTISCLSQQLVEP